MLIFLSQACARYAPVENLASLSWRNWAGTGNTDDAIAYILTKQRLNMDIEYSLLCTLRHES